MILSYAEKSVVVPPIQTAIVAMIIQRLRTGEDEPFQGLRSAIGAS